jgi:hypothetical protein
VFGVPKGLLCRPHRAPRSKAIWRAEGPASRSRKSRPVISTLASSVNCLRPTFRSTMSSSRVR